MLVTLMNGAMTWARPRNRFVRPTRNMWGKLRLKEEPDSGFAAVGTKTSNSITVVLRCIRLGHVCGLAKHDHLPDSIGRTFTSFPFIRAGILQSDTIVGNTALRAFFECHICIRRNGYSMFYCCTSFFFFLLFSLHTGCPAPQPNSYKRKVKECCATSQQCFGGSLWRDSLRGCLARGTYHLPSTRYGWTPFFMGGLWPSTQK